jgi:hypothetical protein
VTKSDPAARLSADLLPWERQPEETDGAYAAFESWLHSEKRQLKDYPSTARNWSARYHWVARAHEYDIYISRVDLQEQVRYRRKMNARHRQIASVAQAKLVTWLNGLDPARMSTADAIRLLDVAVKIEREATAAVDAEDLPEPYVEPARVGGSIEQRLKAAGLDVPMSEVAEALRKVLDPSVSEPTVYPSRRPLERPESTPAEPEGVERRDVFAEPGHRPQPAGIWGEQ